LNAQARFIILKMKRICKYINIEHGVIYTMAYPIPSYKLYINNTDAHEKQINGIGNTQVQQGQTIIISKCVNKHFHQCNK
jgi:hypothetical protein